MSGQPLDKFFCQSSVRFLPKSIESVAMVVGLKRGMLAMNFAQARITYYKPVHYDAYEMALI